jgi:hypothetical protein
METFSYFPCPMAQIWTYLVAPSSGVYWSSQDIPPFEQKKDSHVSSQNLVDTGDAAHWRASVSDDGGDVPSRT